MIGILGHHNLALGHRNSPFVSYWHVHLGGLSGRAGVCFYFENGDFYIENGDFYFENGDFILK